MRQMRRRIGHRFPVRVGATLCDGVRESRNEDRDVGPRHGY